MVVTGCESHCNGCGQDARTLCLCTTAIVISIVSLTPALSAVSRDCRRACGARGRRWAPRSLQWQAQYPEPPEGAAARVVAAGPPAVLCVTAIVICKAMVVTGCESHCNGCGQDVRTLCLCTTAILIHSLTHSLTHTHLLPPLLLILVHHIITYTTRLSTTASYTFSPHTSFLTFHLTTPSPI